MFIGSGCFRDIEIRALLEQVGSRGDCSFTSEKGVAGYDTDSPDNEFDLSDSFYDILSTYVPQTELSDTYPEKHLDYIEKHLTNDWSIFSDKVSAEDVKAILQEICKDYYDSDDAIFIEKVGIPELNDPEYLNEKCLTKDKDWESFVESIKEVNRFHSSQINLKVLEELFNSEGLQRKIRKKDNPYRFIRGRICDDDKIIPSREMGAPPKKLASSGRINSKGIRCLYLTTDEWTSLHEIRARDHDYVTIAEFIPNKQMTLVDLTRLDMISPFEGENSFDARWFAINMPIIKKISREIARPLMRNDSEIDYLPTQYIADFIRTMGFDGICYNSTLSDGGVNFAIFDPDNFKFKEEYLIRVKPVKFDYYRVPF